MSIEKIAVDGHYVWVDKDTEIKEGDWFYQLNSNRIIKHHKLNGLLLQPQYFDKKIVAVDAELELQGIPTYVEFLSNEHNKTYFDYDKTNTQPNYDFISGYKAAEKDLFTEDDVRKAIVLSRNLCREQHIDGYDEYTYSEAEIIEQLKQSKTK